MKRFAKSRTLSEDRVDWLDIGVVGKFRVGQDGGRVGVDQGDAQSFLFKDAAGLGARVVELTSLNHDDRAPRPAAS